MHMFELRARSTNHTFGLRAAEGSLLLTLRTAPIRARHWPLLLASAASVEVADVAATSDTDALNVPGPVSVRVPLPSSRTSMSPAFRAILALSASALPAG